MAQLQLDLLMPSPPLPCSPSQRLAALAEIPDLTQALQRLIKQIPCGKVTTYGALGKALGDVRASRWIGSFAVNHQHTEHCCCHRIVRSDGEIGLYVTGVPAEKGEHLAAEGSLKAHDRANLRECFFDDFESDAPLNALRKRQLQAAQEARLESSEITVSEIGGLDISYRDEIAYATLVCLGAGQTDPIWHHTVCQPIRFPYIPSYLTFRELPVYAQLLADVAPRHELPRLMMVDGSGALHPCGCGIATMLGVETGMATIGIAKKRLCGSYSTEHLASDGTASVIVEQRRLGTAVLGPAVSRKPVFISPGHLASVDSALAISRRFWGKRRLPAPIHWADRLSREAAQMEDVRAAQAG